MKTKCRVCANENSGFCKVKKTTVKTNKARACKYFQMDTSKIQVKQDLPTTFRPEWYHDRKAYVNKLKKEEKLREEARIKELFNPTDFKVPGLDGLPGKATLLVTTPHTGDAKYPITGDLSRFVSTAGNVELEKK
jgi:hypothetical protein